MSTKSRGSLGKVQERKVVKKKKVKQIKDMKNGRKGGGSGNGSLSLLKKGGSGSNNSTTTTSCNNSLLPGLEDKERRMLVKRRVSFLCHWHIRKCVLSCALVCCVNMKPVEKSGLIRFLNYVFPL